MANYVSNAPKGLDLEPSIGLAPFIKGMRDFGYEVSPGYGDYLAGERSVEAFGNMGQALQEMELMNAASYAAQGVTEGISMLPGVGDIASAAKGLSGLAGTMVGRKGMEVLDPARAIKSNEAALNSEGIIDQRNKMWEQAQSYYGAEGLPRFEISDKDAFVDVDAVTPYFTRGEMDKINKLQDVFHHKEFFKAYPDFNPTVASFRDPGNDMMAAYDEVEDTIYINISSLKDEAKETGLSMADTLKRVMLHENQHGVQALEGFARGGNSVESVYRRLAGENESYMVGSSRADLPLEISKMFPPFDTNMPYSMRYPLEEQVVRMSPGTSNALRGFPNAKPDWLHGSPSGDVDKLNEPVFLTKNPEGADFYAIEKSATLDSSMPGSMNEPGIAYPGATIYPYNYKPEKPLDLTTEDGLKDLFKTAKDAGINVQIRDAKDWNNLIPMQIDELSKNRDWSFFSPELENIRGYGENPFDLVYLPEVREALKKKGYDALQGLDDFLNTEGLDTLVPLYPERLKRTYE